MTSSVPSATNQSDLVNLAHAVEFAALVLTRDLRVHCFTPAVTQLFDIQSADVGRPIGEIALKFSDAQFPSNAMKVLESRVPLEKEVPSNDGRVWLERITPCDTFVDQNDCVILSFTNISGIRKGDYQTQLFTDAIKYSADAVVVHDFDGRIIAWNRGAQQMYGYAEPEALTLNFADLIAAEQRSMARSIWQRLQQGERVISWETRHKTRDGRLLEVWVTGTLLADDTGKPIAIAKIVRDITELKQHQSQLELEVERRVAELVQSTFDADRSKAKFEAVFEAVQDGMLMYNMAGEVVMLNAGGMRILGMENVGGMKYRLDYFFTIFEVAGLDGQPIPEDQWPISRALRGETFSDYEILARRKDTGQSWVLTVNGAPVRDQDGQQIFAIVNFHDISRRQRSEAMLREQQEQLRAVLDTASDAIITINSEGIVQSCNPAVEQMMGYLVTEMIGKNVSMIMPAPHRNEHDNYLARYLRTGDARIIGRGRELEARHKDGTLIPVELVVSRVNHTGLFTGIVRDISRRKALEREIVEIAILEQQRIGQDLHDECGQELTALGLLSGSIVAALEDKSPEIVEIARKIERGVGRVHRQVRGISQGLIQAQIDPARLQPALAELAKRLNGTAGIRCEFHGDGRIRITDGRIATQLFHIAQEACTNAIKHSKADKIEIAISILDSAIRLQIQDNGIGLAKVNREGLGHRIMTHRASVIGAGLSIASARPHGTVVTCTIHEEHSDA